MAFCQNCGNQLADDQVFCPACGAKNGAASAASGNKAVDFVKGLPKKTLFMYIAGILNLFNILFICLKTVYAKIDLGKLGSSTEKQSLVKFFDDMNLAGVGVICLIITIILCLAAAASVALPAIPGVLKKPLPAKLAGILNIVAGYFAIHFLFLGQMGVAGITKAMGGKDASVGATFAGWLVLLFGLGAIVLTVLSWRLEAKENK